MKLKKLIYSIAAASMITPVAIGSFNQVTVQASTKGHSVSKKIAIKYAYKVRKKAGFKGGTKSDFSRSYVVLKHHKNTEVVEDYPDSSFSYRVSEKGKYIKVNTSVMVRPEPFHPFQKADNKFYKSYNLKRHYTFKIKKHKHHKKSHVTHNNKVTVHDIKSKNYYGKKAIGYYGFKHANGFWDMNRDLSRYVVMDHNVFGFWQAGNGAAYKVKGNYVQFDQSMLMTKKKPLIVKISKVIKYSNAHGGKSMLKNIKTIGTDKELSKLTNE